MEISKLDEIRKLGIIAMSSDDELVEMLVLKGGNAIALFYSEYSPVSVFNKLIQKVSQSHMQFISQA